MEAAALCFNGGLDHKVWRFRLPDKMWVECRKEGGGNYCSDVIRQIQKLALEEEYEDGYNPNFANEGMRLLECSKELWNTFDARPIARVLATVDVGDNETADRRRELMVLADKIGAHRFGDDFLANTIGVLADKSPDDRQSLLLHGMRLLNETKDDALIRLCLDKLLGSPRSLHEQIVNVVARTRSV